ncbi:glycosyltransferase [Butyrivibrio fibrisolvens]|uniref:glycosyltransferase n=1 Tax=Butyrivibrio fibrisolvens TaxID=831 RepID=UPI0004897B27|nr:glycosyltransferase [Butyrivibrio fibrisolvens]
MECHTERNYSMIIVDYNTIAATVSYIKYCKSALISKGNIGYIIVDNSEDASGLEYLKQHYELSSVKEMDKGQIYSFELEGISVYYYATYENLGYAKGNNLGAELSYSLFGDSIFVFSNNDILFEGKLNLDIAGDKFTKDVAVVGPDILEGDKHLNPMYKKSLMNCLYGNMIKALQRKVEDHYTFSGCFWFFDSVLFKQVGGFDPNTFLYFEEYIIEERIRRAGLKMVYCPEVTVIHDHDYKKETPQHFEKVSRLFLKSLCYYAREYKGVSNIKMGFIKYPYLIILKLFVLLKHIL